jgi:hypothetical protein
MLLTRAQLAGVLAGTGIPLAELFDPDTLGANVFATVSREWVASVCQAALEELRQNAPQLVALHDIGGGKTVLVPRYILNGFCCRGHALKIYSHGMTGFALSAALAPAPLDHDGLAFGFYHFTASPRAGNGYRTGRHEKVWGIDHDGAFFSFEPGDNAAEQETPAELATMSFLFAQ